MDFFKDESEESIENKKKKGLDFDFFIDSFSSLTDALDEKKKEPEKKDEQKTSRSVGFKEDFSPDTMIETLRFKHSKHFIQLLKDVVYKKGSDLHISSDYSPLIRIFGDLTKASAHIFDEKEIKDIIYPILVPAQIEEFEKTGDVDFSYEEPGVARFRVNFYRKNNGLGASFRLIPSVMPLFDSLDLPPILKSICNYQKGLVLITGATGSGKSTTLAAIINEINLKRRLHIITIEDPLEYVHSNKSSIITHRQIGSEANNFADAIRSARNANPDVIMIGEMRDLETVEETMKAVEMGILVLATLHTNDCPKTVDRLIDIFPNDQQPQIRTILSEYLRAVVSQQLVKRKDKKGQVPVVEVLFETPGLANLIREGKTPMISSLIQTGKEEGMLTIDNSLIDLYLNKIISKETAKEYARDTTTFERMGIMLEE